MNLLPIMDLMFQEPFAFGDGGNDISMIRAAGMGIAMGELPRL